MEASEPQPASERRRPSPSWLLLIGLLVVVALVGGVLVGAVAWPDDRPAGSRTADVSSVPQRPTTSTAAGPMASAACKAAVDRANAMLASAVRLREAVFDRALANYRQVVDQCKLQPLEPAGQVSACMVAKTITFDHRPIRSSPVMLLMALLSPRLRPFDSGVVTGCYTPVGRTPLSYDPHSAKPGILLGGAAVWASTGSSARWRWPEAPA